MEIKLFKGDITQLNTDAIVNAANKTLLGGGGVDGAIHRAAGPELLEECKTLNGCETGHAKLTSAYALPSRYIIHTVGPVWHGGENEEARLLRDCYINCLTIADNKRLGSIAFPNISTGVYGYPKKEAAEIAIRSAREFKAESLSEVIFVVFDEVNYKIYTELLS